MAERHVPIAEFRVLLSLVDGPKHGHGIRIDVRSRTADRVDMGPGTLYGAVKRLVRRGWIVEIDAPAGDDDQRRRYYELTSTGRAVARAEVERLQELLAIAEAKRLGPRAARA